VYELQTGISCITNKNIKNEYTQAAIASWIKILTFTAPFGAVFLYQKSERKNYNGT
jgi:hypothetical protein